MILLRPYRASHYRYFTAFALRYPRAFTPADFIVLSAYAHRVPDALIRLA